MAKPYDAKLIMVLRRAASMEGVKLGANFDMNMQQLHPHFRAGDERMMTQSRNLDIALAVDVTIQTLAAIIDAPALNLVIENGIDMIPSGVLGVHTVNVKPEDTFNHYVSLLVENAHSWPVP
mmetsp:Transcript_12472/g.18613  ORF Transcript_12472/g.18613 Transcript_12472/m.18613 type:complete len:122 (+) Transcript_12472:313-678(+)